jgi:hypothetical protein
MRHKQQIIALLLCTYLLYCPSARAQSFEGVLRYKINYDYEDSVRQQKTLSQRALAESPETQQKVKELKVQLDEYKYGTSARDRIERERLDSLVHITLSGGSKAPNGLLIMIKDGNVLTRMEGGSYVLRKELLYLKNEERGAWISTSRKNYLYNPSVVPPTPPGVVKKDEIIQIQGFPCQRYDVELQHKKGYPSNQIIWATKAISNIDRKMFLKIGNGMNQENMLFDCIDGIPLRIQSFFPGASSTLELVEIRTEKLRDTEFIIPAGFFRIPDTK